MNTRAFLTVRASYFEGAHARLKVLGRVRDGGVGTAEDASLLWFEVLFDKPITLEQVRAALNPLEVAAFQWLNAGTGRDLSLQMPLFS